MHLDFVSKEKNILFGEILTNGTDALLTKSAREVSPIVHCPLLSAVNFTSSFNRFKGHPTPK